MNPIGGPIQIDRKFIWFNILYLVIGSILNWLDVFFLIFMQESSLNFYRNKTMLSHRIFFQTNHVT